MQKKKKTRMDYKTKPNYKELLLVSPYFIELSKWQIWQLFGALSRLFLCLYFTMGQVRTTSAVTSLLGLDDSFPKGNVLINDLV